MNTEKQIKLFALSVEYLGRFMSMQAANDAAKVRGYEPFETPHDFDYKIKEFKEKQNEILNEK